MIPTSPLTNNETIPGLIPLSKLRADQQGVVVEVCSCPLVCRRLATMGIAPGTCVQMLLSGRTCLIKAGRSRMSMRCDDLESILVETI